MTEEIYGSVWQDDVVALAVENSDIEMAGTATETLRVYAVFGGSVASQLKDNSNFTFALENNTGTTTSNIEVGANTGIITTTGASAGTAVVSVTLTDHDNVPPAYAVVTITG